MDKPKNPYKKGTIVWAVMEGDWEDLTVTQIAEALGTVPNRISAYITRIRKKTGYSVPHLKGKTGRKKGKPVGKRMNKQHYKWWGYIKAVIQEYPRARSSELSGVALREHEAVKKAVDATLTMDNGANRLKVISAVHWERARTLEGAALEIPCGPATAARWQRKFFEEVARNRDLMD